MAIFPKWRRHTETHMRADTHTHTKYPNICHTLYFKHIVVPPCGIKDGNAQSGIPPGAVTEKMLPLEKNAVTVCDTEKKAATGNCTYRVFF